MPPHAKFRTIVGYFCALVCLGLTASYIVSLAGHCTTSDFPGLNRAALFNVAAEALVTAGIIALTFGLRNHTNASYRSAALNLTLLFTAFSILFAVGYTFAVSTACTS